MNEVAQIPEVAQMNPEVARMNSEVARMNSEVARMNSEVAQMNSEVAEMNYLPSEMNYVCREMISASAGIFAADGAENFYFDGFCHRVHGEDQRFFWVGDRVAFCRRAGWKL
ncbi:MAG: hypothetical protein IPM21_03150 [Acidobacteria bacterium]|nr:hypothetical protein [Acidobacteriota bacterium]